MLQVSNLCVDLPGQAGMIRIVDNVNFSVEAKKVLGIVGESGSGKSITCASMLGLLPSGARVSGSVKFNDREILGLSERSMQELRGAEVGYVFQDPMTSLNPTMTVGAQIVETIRRHRNISRRAAWDRAVELLDKFGISQSRRRAHDYPHEYSGGMRQRAMIAMAICCDPKLVIADEPTTALDVTVQAQILDLMLDMRESMDLSIIFISHDLSVIANVCDDVMVMYAGEVVESAPVDKLFTNPCHPYTRALLSATQRVPGKPLITLDGAPPAPGSWDAGCRFRDRCSMATDACSVPPLLEKHASGIARCHYVP